MGLRYDKIKFNVTLDHVPAHVLRRLSSGSIRVLKEILTIKRVNQARSGREHNLLQISECYLADVCELSRTHVSRCIKKLEYYKLVFVRRVRKSDGRYRVSLYNIGKSIINVVKSLVNKEVMVYPHRVRRRLQEVTKINSILVNEPSIGQIIENMKRKFGVCNE